jgi:hypothetical protein
MAGWGMRRGEVWGGGVQVGRQAEASCRDDKLAVCGCSIELELVVSVKHSRSNRFISVTQGLRR